LGLTISPLIRRDLFCVRRLNVIPGDDSKVPVKAFFLGKEGLNKIAGAYGADVVVVGFLEAKEGQCSIELRACDVTTGLLALKTTVSGKLSSLPDLEKRLVGQLLAALDIKLQRDERRKISAQDPGNFSAFMSFAHGLVYEKKGLLADALMSYQKTLMDDKELAVPCAAQARVYKEMNAPLKAMQSYQQAVERDPFFAEAWYRLNLYAAQYNREDEKAIEYCRKALEIAPSFGKARLSLGTRLHDLGRLDEAIEETKLAASNLRADPIPPYNLGLYYLEAGEPSEARQWLETALRLDPRFELARTELDKLAEK
jgi:tetratricopeptide (TPR) repeat protein